MKKNSVRKLVLASMFLAIGFVLPMITGQIKQIGQMLLPMHLPVMLCGLICGPSYGAAVGLLLPFARSVVFGMPPLYPNAVWMSLELATYGLIIGLIYKLLKKQNTLCVTVSLLAAMLSGRIVWGIAKAILLGLGGKKFGFSMFIAGGFTEAIPGIILQLILIPAIMMLVNRKEQTQ